MEGKWKGRIPWKTKIPWRKVFFWKRSKEADADRSKALHWKKKLFQRDNLIILVLSGILLVIIALPIRENSENVKENDRGVEDTPILDIREQVAEDENIIKKQEGYASYLEQRLEQVLSGMYGVGRVNVMIIMESSEELVIEKDEPFSHSSTIESDSEGGKREITQIENNQSTVYRNIGNDSEPFVVKTLTPKVGGVVVIAEGADTGNINKSITEAVQALFGVGPHKIKVLKMEPGG